MANSGTKGAISHSPIYFNEVYHVKHLLDMLEHTKASK